MPDNPEQQAPLESAPAEQSGQPEPIQSQPIPVASPESQPNFEAQAERLRSQVSGMQPFAEPLTRAGIQPDQIAGMIASHQQVQRMNEMGFNIDSMLGQAPVATPQAQPEQSPLTIDSLGTYLDGRDELRIHEAADRTSMNTLDAFSTEIGGDNAALVKGIVNQAAIEYMQQNGRLYPQGHSLHADNYMPMNEADVSAIKQAVHTQLDTLRGMHARQQVENGIPNTATLGQTGNTEGAAGQGQSYSTMDKEAKRAMINKRLQQNMGVLNGETISNA